MAMPVLVACSDSEARERLSAVELRLSDIDEALAPSLVALELRQAIEDRGTGLVVHELRVESDDSGQYPRVVADVEIRNDADYPQTNRFLVVALTPRGAVLTMTGTSNVPRAIDNWSVLPADSSQRGVISATDYRAASWSDDPQPPERVVEDLLAIDRLIIFVDGTARVAQLTVAPARGRINEYVPPAESTTSTPTFELWSAYLQGLGEGTHRLETFNPAMTLARLASILSIDKTGHHSGHPQAVACAAWLLTGSGSGSDCGYQRVE
jgi:hypothetical protein